MSTYEHRYLTEHEKAKFIELFRYNVSYNILASIFFSSFPFARCVILIFPCISITLSYYAVVYLTSGYINELSFLLLFFAGFLFLKLKFDFAHMFAHSLMLDYDLWNKNNMTRKFGIVSTVIFYAFDHHHEDGSEFFRKGLGLTDYEYYMSIVFTHWESFSMFTYIYPFPGVCFVAKILTIFCIFSHVNAVPFVLGHEVGAMLLPVAHDWVHERLSNKYGLFYLLKPLETIGIFASKKDHKVHHKHIHRYVYKSFSSSGLYSKTFDIYINALWRAIHDQSKGNKTEASNMFLMYVLIVYMLATITLATICIAENK